MEWVHTQYHILNHLDVSKLAGPYLFFVPVNAIALMILFRVFLSIRGAGPRLNFRYSMWLAAQSSWWYRWLQGTSWSYLWHRYIPDSLGWYLLPEPLQSPQSGWNILPILTAGLYSTCWAFSALVWVLAWEIPWGAGGDIPTSCGDVLPSVLHPSAEWGIFFYNS